MKQHLSRGIELLRSLTAKLDPETKKTYEARQVKAREAFAKHDEAVVQANAQELREAGVDQALIEDMVQQLRRELQGQCCEKETEDATATRERPHLNSAAVWKSNMENEGQLLFEE